MTPRAVALGTSAGAVDALSVILPALPAEYALPVFVVVHLPPDRKSAMVELFREKCRVEVKEAEDKEPARGGTVYFAPPDYHLLVERDHRLSLSSEEPVLYSRPSVDVLFETAADAFGPSLVAAVLTGANSDGSRGLRAVLDAGGTGLIQDPATAYSAMMPEAARALCPAAEVLPLPAIVARLLEIGESK